MRTYKLYYTGAASADGAASVIVQKSCRIKAVRWEVALDQVADNSNFAVELSTRNTSQVGSHDSLGDVSQIRQYGNLVTSGVVNGGIRKQDFVDFPVAATERLYLNVVITTTTAYIACFVDVAE